MVDLPYEDAVQQLKELNGKKLKSTAKEGLDIEDDDEKKKLEKFKAMFEPSTKLIKVVIGDKVEKMVISRRMVDSPCVLTTSLYGWSATPAGLVVGTFIQLKLNLQPKPHGVACNGVWLRDHFILNHEPLGYRAISQINECSPVVGMCGYLYNAFASNFWSWVVLVMRMDILCVSLARYLSSFYDIPPSPSMCS